MIATIDSQVNSRRANNSDDDRFLTMLPLIRSQAFNAFRFWAPCRRNEAIQEVIAGAYAAYARLVEQGRGELAYATPLAQYAIRRYHAGRRVGGCQAGNDVMSFYAQKVRGITVESLNVLQNDFKLRETIVEDRNTGPAEVAAARIDVADWLASLPVKLRQIALTLATGATTAETALQFRLSRGRVSQL